MGIIQLKYGTGSAVPSSLQNGEFAINVDTNQLWFGSGSSPVSKLRLSEVTASGDISASGTIVAQNFATPGKIHLNSNVINTGGDYIEYNNGGFFYKGKGDFHQNLEVGTTLLVNSHITASGDISSSAYIYGDRYYSNGQVALNNDGTSIVLGNHNTYPIRIGKQVNPISIMGHITASGNISASGTVTSLTGSFNQLSVTSTGDTASPPLDGHLFRITDTSNNNPDIDHFFVENDALTYGMRWHYDGGDNDFSLYRHNNSSVGEKILEFSRTSNNSTFYGDTYISSTSKLYCNGTQVAYGDGTGVVIGQSNRPLTIDGTNLFVDSSITASGNICATGNILAGWNGSKSRIKILARDFIPDDAGRPAMIDDTGSDRWLESHGTAKLFASIPIPTGFKATHVNIYGSATSAITVYEADINSKTVTSKGTGNIGTEIDITDVTSDTTNYLLIEFDQASGEEIYGGYVTIEDLI